MLKRYNILRFSYLLLEQQLILFGKYARLPDTSPLRQLIFQERSIEPRARQAGRRRGRPRASWMNEISKMAHRAIKDFSINLQDLIAQADKWKMIIRNFCRSQDPFSSDIG